MERSVDDCYRDIGKLHIPVRWVVTKGDELHPNVRCRLVAKHLAAKYGGKDVEDLFRGDASVRIDKVLADQGSPKEQLGNNEKESNVY